MANPHVRCAMICLQVMLVVLAVRGTAAAQTALVPSTPSPGWLRSAEPLPMPRLAQPAPSRDSLKNGTIIGAVVGAVALGTFAAVLCNALREPAEPRCTGDTIRIAGIGAAIGAGVGLAVDAARGQRGGVGVGIAIRF